MNILFYVGEIAVSYAFPQVGAAVATMRYARTAYNVAKAFASIFSGDVAVGGFSLASAAVSAAGPTMGPLIPIPGVSAAYLNCVRDCQQANRGYLWILAACMATCEHHR